VANAKQEKTSCEQVGIRRSPSGKLKYLLLQYSAVVEALLENMSQSLIIVVSLSVVVSVSFVVFGVAVVISHCCRRHYSCRNIRRLPLKPR
jgi:hypothetical protein